MRVVQLGPFPPPHGGVQTNLVAIRDYLRQQGHSCAVINITRHRKPEEDEVFYPESAGQLVRLLATGRYDVIHLHVGGLMPMRVVALALACASIPGSKSVLTFHSGGYPASEEGKRTKRNSLRAFAFRKFNGIISVNRQLSEYLRGLGIKNSRLRLIYPHSVGATKIADHLIEPLVTFYAKHDPKLIGVCLLEPEYDLSRQIAAMEEVLKTSPQAGLVIIGSGSLNESLREEIASKSYADHVLLCGDIPHDVTLRAIADTDILLRTTLYDGDAVSVREALYLGTPVIATDNGMRPPGCDLIPIGDTAALVAAIRQRLEKGRSPAPLAEDDKANLAAVLHLYNDVLGRS